MYTSPDDEAGNFEPSHLVSSIQQHYVDDDQQMLLDIEQNIANLERSKFMGYTLRVQGHNPFDLLKTNK